MQAVKGVEIGDAAYASGAFGSKVQDTIHYERDRRSFTRGAPGPAGISITVDKNTKVAVKGIDKEMVGQVAAELRGMRPPDSYKGKGVRYADERIRIKAGKAGQ